jgi:hypothetical protein
VQPSSRPTAKSTFSPQRKNKRRPTPIGLPRMSYASINSPVSAAKRGLQYCLMGSGFDGHNVPSLDVSRRSMKAESWVDVPEWWR